VGLPVSRIVGGQLGIVDLWSVLVLLCCVHVLSAFWALIAVLYWEVLAPLGRIGWGRIGDVEL
jgi:hypothetical protein